MNDPRLNSIHLELPRRQEFRAARDVLLSGRGDNTMCAEARAELPGAADNLTAIQELGAATALAVKFVLLDKDGTYPLKIGLNTVGRMPDNDVVIEDAYVSRRHCAILVHADNRCELHDVASKNGTYLNGRKIAGPTALKSGDEIRMCTRTVVFMSHQANPSCSVSQQTHREE